jgi:hypothetical protein
MQFLLGKSRQRHKPYELMHQPMLFRGMWSTSLIHWSIVLWSARKPNWLAFSKFLSSVCFWIVLKISFSNSLPVVNKRLIGRMFWGNSGTLRGFGRVMFFAAFQGAGKWLSRKEWLHKCAKCTRGLFGICQRDLFGMPSGPPAFQMSSIVVLSRRHRVGN